MKEINMLGDKEAVANIAVKNLETAKKFYEETLGLTQIGVGFLSPCSPESHDVLHVR